MAKLLVRVPVNKIETRSQEDPAPTPKRKVYVKVKKGDPTQAYDNYNKEIDTNLPAYTNDIKNFYNSYITSPRYKQMLIGQGYKNPDDAIKLRQANINVTPVQKKYSTVSEYNTNDHVVNISPFDELQIPNANMKSILAHELSHVGGAIHYKMDKYPSPMKLSEKEFTEILNRNRLSKMDYSKLSDEEKYHDIAPQENKADLDALRYRLYSDKLYDAGTQNFNKEMLQKAKQKYSADLSMQRLSKYFSDDDIIWMMNNIAKNSTNNSNKV